MIFASQCLFRTYYEFYYERASQDMAACLTQPKPRGEVRQLYIFVCKLRTTHVRGVRFQIGSSRWHAHLSRVHWLLEPRENKADSKQGFFIWHSFVLFFLLLNSLHFVRDMPLHIICIFFSLLQIVLQKQTKVFICPSLTSRHQACFIKFSRIIHHEPLFDAIYVLCNNLWWVRAEISRAEPSWADFRFQFSI